MNIEEVRIYTLSLYGVTEDQPFGDDVLAFRIEGKIFLCLSLTPDNARFSLKLAPERNEELREQFEGVAPAFHWNKKHWSDIFYTQFEQSLLEEWISESYHLVLSTLPRRIRAQYMEGRTAQ
jgi:predicted DNA-binding protein (MmcQ/YjbR family)